MLFNVKQYYDLLHENFSHRRLQTDSNISVNARLLDKIDTTNNTVNKLLFKISNNKMTKYNIQKHKYSVFFNDINFTDYNKIIKDKDPIPIERKTIKLKKNDENLYHFHSQKKINYILNKKLKPTPFQKYQAKNIFGKRAVLIKQYLNNSSDIDGAVLKNISLPYLSKRNKKNMNSRNIGIYFSDTNNYQNKTSLLKRKKGGQYYFNLKNIEYAEKIINKNKSK